MPLREKRAWFSVLVNLAVYGAYFAVLAAAYGRTGTVSAALSLGLMFKSITVLVILLILLNIIAAAMAPRDAKAPEDEREKLIAWRASNVAFYVLSTAVVGAIFAIFFGLDAMLVANGLFLGLVLAEVMRNAMQIYYFRRGV